MDKPYIFVGIPVGENNSVDSRLDSVLCAARSKMRCAVSARGNSCVCKNCNNLFSAALNMRDDGITHFCLLHADIIPQGNWLEELYNEMVAHNLEVLSCVVPMKGKSRNGRFEVSTAWSPDGDVRNMTLEEFGLNRTRINDNKPPLLINTGVCLMDLRRNWDDFAFSMHDYIYKKDGKYAVGFEPEDYRAAVWFHQHGVRYGATSKVKVIHTGKYDWTNWEAEK